MTFKLRWLSLWYWAFVLFMKEIRRRIAQPKTRTTHVGTSVHDQHDMDLLTYEWAGYIERRRP